MIANSRLIISEYKLLQKVTDAIQKRKIFMESEEFNFSSNGEIELGLYEFAERYMYTSLCKERIHQKYPLELVYQTHPDEEVFLEYMKDRQEKMFNKKTVSESLIE